ncbi:MAG: NUDIX hydrolase, partial [Lentisphaeraceae bacterium]|nr:NUDIX hydrolase [Lentisphaeraceae bacterium]
MHRQQFISLLKNYEGQPQVTQQILTFVEENSECFERHFSAGHITASGWLVSADGQKVLLTHHRKLNMWLQPGGHCDGEADVLQVALKETREESGIEEWCIVDSEIFDVDVHAIPANPKEGAHYHYDVRFIFQAVENEQYVVSEESHDLA